MTMFSLDCLPAVLRYLTACANDFCREAKRQTISAQDVMQAIKELEFGELEEPLREYLEQVAKIHMICITVLPL